MVGSGEGRGGPARESRLPGCPSPALSAGPDLLAHSPEGRSRLVWSAAAVSGVRVERAVAQE